MCSDAYEPDNITLTAPDAALQNLDLLWRNCTNEAFKDFFNSPSGRVPRQTDMVRRGRINRENHQNTSRKDFFHLEEV